MPRLGRGVGEKRPPRGVGPGAAKSEIWVVGKRALRRGPNGLEVSLGGALSKGAAL